MEWVNSDNATVYSYRTFNGTDTSNETDVSDFTGLKGTVYFRNYTQITTLTVKSTANTKDDKYTCVITPNAEKTWVTHPSRTVNQVDVYGEFINDNL